MNSERLLKNVRPRVAEKGFAFALIASAAIHVALFSLLWFFAPGYATGRVQPDTETGIEAFLVSGIPAAAGRTAVLSGSKQEKTNRTAATFVPAKVISEMVVQAEKENVKPLPEIQASNESSKMGHNADAFSTPVIIIPGSGSSGNIGPDVSVAYRGNGESSRGDNTRDLALRREGMGISDNADAVPRYEDNTLPAYPPLARLRGYQGETVLSVEVLADGRVGQIGISRSTGHEILDRTALEAVRSWRFCPGRSEGRPVTMSVAVPFRFVLTGNSVLVKADKQ